VTGPERGGVVADQPTFEEVRAAVGRMIRQTREKAGMDIQTVARRSELDPGEIQAIEEGADPEPCYSDFILLAGALGIEPGHLLGIALFEPSYTPGVAGRYVWAADLPMKLEAVPPQCPPR
jgi:transcriptional regulator with XRE-family HTH domain